MLIADSVDKDLGNLKFGEAHNFKYILTNTGDKTITITKIVLGCNSCTKASIEKQILGVAETSELYVTFTPGSTGVSSKGIIVQYTMAHIDEHLNLKFKAIITK